MYACLFGYECMHVIVCVSICVRLFILLHMYMYAYMYVYVYIYGCFYFSQNYAFFLFLEFFNEKFQQCTKAKLSKVYTSAPTFFPINL